MCVCVFLDLVFFFSILSSLFSWLGNNGIMTEDEDLLLFTNLAFAAYSVVGILLVAIRFPLSIKNLDLSNWEVKHLIFFFHIFLRSNILASNYFAVKFLRRQFFSET